MMVVLIVYVFTVAIYAVATGASRKPGTTPPIAIVDEDRSPLSQRHRRTRFYPPYFQPPALIWRLADGSTRHGRGHVHLRARHSAATSRRDVRAGRQRRPSSSTSTPPRMSQAFTGGGYVQHDRHQ
ncbi:MAG: hypothetical protein MZV49_18645 [Rhodopseudomonas palustris]|nr:hypothetical protein [Rhodopseudomonas palustris]